MDQNNKKPYISVAAICEKVLQEKNNVLSAIRFVDTMEIAIAQGEAPKEVPPVAINLAALLAFKAGPARGKRTVELRLHSPIGNEIAPRISYPLVFTDDEHGGANVIVNIVFIPKQEGLYWIDVVMGDEVLSRMPLQVKYKGTQTVQPQPETPIPDE